MITQQLRLIPFLRNLPSEELEAISGRLKAEHYLAGDLVFSEGEPADRMYLIASGQVEVVSGENQRTLAALGQGSFVGELSLLLHEPRSASLRASSDTLLLALHQADLEDLLGQYPAIGIEISRELGRRLIARGRQLAPASPTQFTAVFGEGVGDFAGAVKRCASQARVGVVPLRPEGVGTLPADVDLYDGADVQVTALSELVGRDIQGFTHLLLALPSDETNLGHTAIDVAEHIVVLGSTPSWVRELYPSRTVLHGSARPDFLNRAARWVTGQAVGLALSSGGSKAAAHLGALRALQKAGLVIDAVAGTSGGALVAGGLALGMPDETMQEHLRELSEILRFRRMDLNIAPRSALFKGRRLHNRIDSWMDSRLFGDTRIPFWAVASDVKTGAEVVINKGRLSDAIRASLSIPGAMNPWPIEGNPCIDGAVVNPLPADVLRNAGIRRIVGCNVAGQALSITSGKPSFMQIMGRMLNSMEREMLKSQLPLVDVLIRPTLSPTAVFDFSRIEQFVREGERAALEVLPEIKELFSHRRAV
ncbi:patatin-like phospholipase family protein [Streptomyces virginiae]